MPFQPVHCIIQRPVFVPILVRLQDGFFCAESIRFAFLAWHIAPVLVQFDWDYTQIISAVIALISALVSAFLIPWLKTKIDADKLQTLRTYVEIGVKAAEQLYTATDGAAKKAYVVNFLAEKGIQFDVETIDKLIEAAVLQLHHELYGSERA